MNGCWANSALGQCNRNPIIVSFRANPTLAQCNSDPVPITNLLHMQPAHYSNPGLAAYKAPPGLGITSLPASTSDYHRTLPSVANASDLQQTADETTGRATQGPGPEPAVAPVPPPQTKSARKQEHITRPTRERREETARERRETHRVQQSAPVQSHPFWGFGAAYAGYASLH